MAQAREAGFRIIPIPGSSAVIAALMASGLPTDSFHFCRVHAAKINGAAKAPSGFSTMCPSTTIWFESSRRLTACLNDMIAVYGGNRTASVVRELTKTRESIITAPLHELAEIICRKPPKVRLLSSLRHNDVQETALDDTAINSFLLENSENDARFQSGRNSGKRNRLKKSDLYAPSSSAEAMTKLDKKQAAYFLGLEAETKAAHFLKSLNFDVIETRYKTKYGEIDLIARQGDLVLIVEVKARSTLEQAMDAVSRARDEAD